MGLNISKPQGGSSGSASCLACSQSSASRSSLVLGSGSCGRQPDRVVQVLQATLAGRMPRCTCRPPGAASGGSSRSRRERHVLRKKPSSSHVAAQQVGPGRFGALHVHAARQRRPLSVASANDVAAAEAEAAAEDAQHQHQRQNQHQRPRWLDALPEEEVAAPRGGERKASNKTSEAGKAFSSSTSTPAKTAASANRNNIPTNGRVLRVVNAEPESDEEDEEENDDDDDDDDDDEVPETWASLHLDHNTGHIRHSITGRVDERAIGTHRRPSRRRQFQHLLRRQPHPGAAADDDDILSLPSVRTLAASGAAAGSALRRYFRPRAAPERAVVAVEPPAALAPPPAMAIVPPTPTQASCPYELAWAQGNVPPRQREIQEAGAAAAAAAGERLTVPRADRERRRERRAGEQDGQSRAYWARVVDEYRLSEQARPAPATAASAPASVRPVSGVFADRRRARFAGASADMGYYTEDFDWDMWDQWVQAPAPVAGGYGVAGGGGGGSGWSLFDGSRGSAISLFSW